MPKVIISKKLPAYKIGVEDLTDDPDVVFERIVKALEIPIYKDLTFSLYAPDKRVFKGHLTFLRLKTFSTSPSSSNEDFIDSTVGDVLIFRQHTIEVIPGWVAECDYYIEKPHQHQVNNLSELTPGLYVISYANDKWVWLLKHPDGNATIITDTEVSYLIPKTMLEQDTSFKEIQILHPMNPQWMKQR